MTPLNDEQLKKVERALTEAHRSRLIDFGTVFGKQQRIAFQLFEECRHRSIRHVVDTPGVRRALPAQPLPGGLRVLHRLRQLLDPRQRAPRQR